METETVTPELKEQMNAIFLDAISSSIKHHKRAIRHNDNLDNVRSNILGYRDALSTTCDLVFRLSQFTCLISSSLSENLIASKKRGCLTEKGISESFEFMRLLMNLACEKEVLNELCDQYYNKTSLIESIDIDQMQESLQSYIDNNLTK